MIPASTSTDPIRHLYIHVPFCLHKCEYCAFFSEPAGDELVNRYVQALVRELERSAPDLAPRTVYFGGGTPTRLDLHQWETVLGAMDNLHLGGAEEWTVECNPATVSLDKARLLRAHGVNRVSLGIQSFEPALLERLGRVHTRDMAFRAFDLLCQAGFPHINVDLMFAIPGQTLATWRATVDAALALGGDHLSCYEVTYEEDTPLFAQLRAGRVDVDEDLACRMFEELVDRARHHGFLQYEVSNFARSGPDNIEVPAAACRHNVNYWRGGSFYGLGPSATGYVRGTRTRNWADTRRYCQLIEQGRSPVESTECLPPLARAGETAAFGLRMNAGWPFADFERVTGYDLRIEWGADMAGLEREGLGERLEDRFRLTDRGLRFADLAAERFLRS